MQFRIAEIITLRVLAFASKPLPPRDVCEVSFMCISARLYLTDSVSIDSVRYAGSGRLLIDK